MASINKDTVTHLGKLARIAIKPEHVEGITNDLKDILAYVEQLQKVDTKNAPIISQVTGLKDVMRKDEVKSSALSREQLLANAPDTEDGYIKVRRVL